MSWDDAHLVLTKMDQDNAKNMWLFTLPYRIGVGVSMSAAIVSGTQKKTDREKKIPEYFPRAYLNM